MGYRRFIFASDIHGSEQHPEANAALFKFIKIWKPHVRVCGGDLWDFASLRSKASEDEKRKSLLLDYNMGLEWAEKFQPTQFLRGNHSERLWYLADANNGVKSDFAKETIKDIEKVFGKMRCPIFPYDRNKGVFQLGKLKMIHGFGSSARNAAYQAAQIYGSVLLGHFHTIDHVSIPNTENKMGMICGCLCSLTMPYLSTKLNAFAHRLGWAYGVVDDRGNFEVWQAHEVNGKWKLATEIIEL